MLSKKAKYVKIETLKIHKSLPETRIASSLSPIEIFVALYYGNILKFNPNNPNDESRDRFIISKGHGSISMYPILADLGFFPKKELENIGNNFLGSIPDPIIPGYETVNGSLGHGLGVGCGIALALKKKAKNQNVVVLVGDGELNEGAIWESVMFASQHKLDNLTLIVDNNHTYMLDFSKNIIDLEPIKDKFEAFRWSVFEIKDGHDVDEVYKVLKEAINDRSDKPKVVIANTIKGKGIDFLEKSSLSHILSIKSDEIEKYIEELK
jgi:transketolase